MLIFNLKREWFEKIKSGKKTHEYREVKPYWTNRLKLAMEILYKFGEKCYPCEIRLGYPKGTDYNKIIDAKILSIKIINGKNTDLKIDKDVYDIEFEIIKDGEQ